MAYRASFRLASVLVALFPVACSPAFAETPRVIVNTTLARTFATRSPWYLLGVQGAEIPDDGVGPVPGVIKLCLKKEIGGPCAVALEGMPTPAGVSGNEWGAHYLRETKIVYPLEKLAVPLLLIRTASWPSFNGDQGEFTQILAYRPDADTFVPIYKFVTGHNQNQEVRFIESGKLKGAVISAVPTSNAPFGYWVTVNKFGRDRKYRQVLHYRSATHYGDNNPIPVIDSEMPNIQRRLGLWRQGMPLPLPAQGCARPRLVNTELWCN